MSNEIHCVAFNDGALRLDIAFNGDNFEVASIQFKLVSKKYGVLQESGVVPTMVLFELVALAKVSIQERTQRLENELVRMKKEIKRGTKENKKK